MKKSLIGVICSGALILGLSGCGGGQAKPSSSSSTSSGDLIVKINADSNKVERALVNLIANSSHKNIIRNNGVSIKKHIYSSNENCIKMQYINLNETFYTKKYCYKVKRNGSSSEIIGFSSFVGNKLISSTDFTEDFDNYINKTNNIIKLNISKQIAKLNILDRLSKLKKIAESKQNELQQMYQSYFNKYNENISNIKLAYKVQDKSGLLKSKKLDAGYSIVLNVPRKKEYNYDSILNSYSAINSDYDNEYTKAVAKINYQFEEDKKEYKAYLRTAFKTYKIEGSKEKTFKHNEYISFESIVKAPSEIKYNLGKNIKVPVTIIIKSATLTHMVPKQFTLNDSNMNISFEINSNTNISVIAKNKTKSFITLKSLTSYYKNDVYNLSKLDREISPETTTLSSNSNYSLLSDTMISASNFKGITKAKAKYIKINYGYAVKYRLNNTNVNKSMYDTKKYSLYDIFQQYL